MSRRSPSGIQAIIVAAVVALLLFGIYSYNDLHGRLRRSDEKAERLKQQQDSVSAQLQVVYEHKSRLEKSLQQEKEDRLKMKQDMLEDRRQAEKKIAAEKDSRIASLTVENKRLQGLYDDLQTDLSRLQDKQREEEDEKVKVLEQNKLEYMQLKQERDNDVAQLKDQIANLQRRNVNLQRDIDELKLNVPAAQPVEENHADDARRHNKPKSDEALGKDNSEHINKPAALNDKFHKPAGNNEQHNNERKANLVKPIADDTLMQIGKPDDENQKGYYVQKSLKANDRHLKPQQAHPEDDVERNRLGGQKDPQNVQHVLQVVPPKVDESLKGPNNNNPVPKNLLNADDVKALPPANVDNARRGGAEDLGGLNQDAPAQNLQAAGFNQGAGAPNQGLGAQGQHQGVLGPNEAAVHEVGDKVENHIQKDIFLQDNARDVHHVEHGQKPEQIAIPQVQHHNQRERNDNKVGGENKNHMEEEEEQRDDKDYEEEKVDVQLPQRNRGDVRGPNVGPVEEDNL